MLQDEEFSTDTAATDASALAVIRSVGARVRAARKDRGMTRRELSERSGVSPRYLAKLEGGEGNISIGLLHKVALALGTSAEQLLARVEAQSEDMRRVAAMYGRADAATRARVLQVLDPDRLRAQKASRLCLVGLRGAGKSTLGAWLARDIGVPFVELNAEIENRAGMPIGEIIALYGQEGYRQLEADTLSVIIRRHDRVVVAVAGGIVSGENSYYQVLSRFHTVWIKAAAGEHMDRVRAQGDMRPMQGNPQAMIQLRQILKAREAHYAQADHLLDTSGKSLEASQADLLRLVQSSGIFAI